MKPVSFVTGAPALVTGKNLVLADLHLGIEKEFRESGIKFPSQTPKIRERIDILLEETGAERLILLGDVKHKVPGISLQEMREIPEFLAYFAGKTSVEIVPGNHDAGIEKFVPKDVRLHPSEGFLLDGVYFCHGHSWPDPSFMKSKIVVMGHQHPVIEFRDRLNYRFTEQVWLRGKLKEEKIREKYKGKAADGKLPGLPEAVILPAFNVLSGGVPVNRHLTEDMRKNFIGPVIKELDEKSSEVHLLDGTLMGTISELKKARIG